MVRDGAFELNRARMLMNYNSKNTLSENKISSLLLANNSNTNIVITDMMSPDNRYFVFLDEMYDLHEQRKIGNFWDNIDNITLFLKHSFECAKDIPQQIRENCLYELNKITLNESVNYDLGLIKEYTKQIVNKIPLLERTWGEWLYEKGSDLASWLGKNTTDLVTGTTQMVKDAGTGLWNLGSAIVTGDVTKILSLLGQGVLYFARWLRKAMYNPIGMVLDTVLIAVGIGKTVQWVPWAIIVALDIYEFVSGDSDDKDSPLWWRLLSIGFDVLGLVFAGVAAKAAKAEMSVLKNVLTKSPEEIALFVAENPALKKTIEKMLSNVNKVPSFLQKAVDFLMKPFPKAAEWIKGILGKVSGFISTFTSSIGEIFTGKILKKAAKETAVNYGFEKAAEVGMNWYMGNKGGGERVPNTEIPQGENRALASMGKLPSDTADKINKAFDEF